MKYDFLIVGAGLFGAVCAHELAKASLRVLVIDRRPTIGGNCYTEEQDGIIVHRYGPHIYHTDDKKLWDYVANKIHITPTPDYTPIAVSRGEAFNLPFNMNTFARLYGTWSPDEARKIIEKQRKEISGEPRNLQEQAISLVGKDVFERLIQGYTEKQWGRKCEELPPEIIKRLPVRFTYNNTYYNDRYIGIPAKGWTPLFDKLLEGSQVRLGVDFMKEKNHYKDLAKKIIYTGSIDEYFNYSLGRLEYRSLRFETTKKKGDYQGTAVVNWTDAHIPYTRSIEHKYFDTERKKEAEESIVTFEYPQPFGKDCEPFYPVNDAKNNELYEKYLEMARNEEKTIFGGRLGSYKYADMDDTISAAIGLIERTKKELSWRYW